MKIFVKSLHLFILGAYAEYCRRRLDASAARHYIKYGAISSKKLVRHSQKCCRLYQIFNELERSLLQDFAMRNMSLSE